MRRWSQLERCRQARVHATCKPSLLSIGRQYRGSAAPCLGGRHACRPLVNSVATDEIAIRSHAVHGTADHATAIDSGYCLLKPSAIVLAAPFWNSKRLRTNDFGMFLMHTKFRPYLRYHVSMRLCVVVGGGSAPTLMARQCGSLMETARVVRSMNDSRRPGAASPGMTQPAGPGLSAWPALSPGQVSSLSLGSCSRCGCCCCWCSYQAAFARADVAKLASANDSQSHR